MQASTQGMKGQPQAGLAALAQPAQAPKGKSPDDMYAIMARAKDMSDSQLADVLTGKSIDVPQFAAMTVAMGRKSLRNAVDGAQAQQQARQPSVKDKYLAEDAQAKMAQMMAQAPQMGGEGAGIAGIPAPNMESVDMASGGIVAFDEGGEVPRYYDGGPLTADQMQQLMTRGSLTRDPEEIKKDLEEQSMFGMSQRTRAARKDATAKPSMTAAQLDAIAQGQGVFPEGSVALPGGLTPDSLGRYVAGNEIPRPAPVAPKKSGLESIMAGGEAPKSQASQDYLSKLEGLSNKQREGLAALKSQGGGEALMQLGAALFGSPNLAQAAAKGLPMVASTSAATRKEARELERGAMDYDLNLAKAREAAEAGDMDRAFQYKKLAEETKMRSAALGQGTDLMRNLQMLQDPKMMELYQQMNASKKPTDVVSRNDALKQWEDLTRTKQSKYGDFETYYKTINNNLMSATIPGQGANIRPY